MTSSADFDLLWNDALDKYVESAGVSPTDQKLLLQLHDIHDLTKTIEEECAKFESFRRKRTTFFNVLKKTGNCLMILSKIASNAVTQALFAPTAAIFGAVALLVKAADGVSESYDWIEQLFEKLGGFAERLEQYMEAGMVASLRGKVIAILVCVIEILGRATAVMKSGRFKKFAVVLFLSRDEEVKASFDKLARLFENEHSLLHAISYATNRKIEEISNEIDTTTKKTLETTEEVYEKLDTMSITARLSELKALLDTDLLTPAYKKNATMYNEYSESTMEHTGQWLLQDGIVKRWMNRESQLLWVSGGPGSGKSCLSSTLINALHDRYPQDSAHPNRTSVAYFYIKEHDEDLQNLLNMLKTLAYQIAQNDSVFKSYVAGALSKVDAIATPRLLWRNLFLGFFGLAKKLPNAAMIVVDGLDEAPRHVVRELFFLLADLKDQSLFSNRFSWAVFSRPDLSEFVEPVLSSVVAKIEIGDMNATDIAEYIKRRLTDVLVVKQAMKMKGKKVAAKLARDIRDKIMGKADGMFFKIVLIVHQILNKERRGAVFEAIEEAPPQLETMIGHVFEKLLLNTDVDKDDLNELLLWVAFSREELFINQLYAIMKRRTGQPYDALEARLRGTFASIFKLSSTSQPSAQNESKEPDLDSSIATLVENDINNNDYFDIDALSEDESDEPEEPLKRESTQSNDDELNDGEDLSKETMQRFLTTRVRFSHASIRDFLVRPQPIELDRHTGAVPIRIDPKLADAHMANVCLRRVIEYGNKIQSGDITGPDFKGYASRWWSDHLLSAALQALTETQRTNMTRTLVTLFSDDQYATGLIQAMADNYLTTKLVYLIKDPSLAAAVRDRFLKLAQRDDFSEKQWHWIQASIGSSKEFFRPLAMAASKLFLTRSGPDDPNYDNRYIDVYHGWLMWTWLFLDSSHTPDIGRLFYNQFPLYDEAMYQSFVDSFEHTKTHYWQAAHGYFLLGGSNYALAGEAFRAALEIDSTCWDALEGLVLSCKRPYDSIPILPRKNYSDFVTNFIGRCSILDERYKEGMEYLDKALECLPSNLTKSAQRLESMIVLTLLGQKDYRAVVDRCGTRYSTDPSRLEVEVLDSYFWALYALQDLDRIHQVLKDISAFPKGVGLIIAIRLNAAYKEMGVALRKHDAAEEILQPWVDEFFDPVRKGYTSMPWAAIWFGSFMYKYYPTIDAAMELFERIASAEFGAMLREDIRSKFEESREEIESKLATIYVEKSRRAIQDERPHDATEFIEKLQDLAAAQGDNSNSLPTYKISMPSLVLGCYLRENGAPEIAWRACIRPTMLLAIDMLSDDDPGNDVEAYRHLHKCFQAAGDTENFVAVSVCYVLACLYPELDKPGFLKQQYTCDGPCTTNNIRLNYRDGTSRNMEYRILSCCQTCYDTGFCEECLEVLKRGEMPYNKCSPEHKHVQIFPVPENLKTRAIMWNSEKEVLEVKQEWLAGLRGEWTD